MPRRHILSEHQRHTLLALPTDEPSLLEHYTLAEDDLEHIRQRRRPHNRLGFALQLCALRYPGRLLSPGEVIPHEVLRLLWRAVAPHTGAWIETLRHRSQLSVVQTSPRPRSAGRR